MSPGDLLACPTFFDGKVGTPAAGLGAVVPAERHAITLSGPAVGALLVAFIGCEEIAMLRSRGGLRESAWRMGGSPCSRRGRLARDLPSKS